LIGCENKPFLPIYGDIPTGTRIASVDDLQRLIDEFNITHLFFVTSDLVAVETRAENLPEIALRYDKNAWNSESSTLGRTINLRDIAYIAVRADYKRYRLALFDGNDVQRHLSVYERIKSGFTLTGESERGIRQIRRFDADVNGFSYRIMADSVLTVSKSGKERFMSRAELSEKKAFHHTHWTVDADTLVIVWENYPKDSVYDLYPLLKSMDLRNKPLLLVFVDGLGYSMLENAKAHKRAGAFQHVVFSPMRTVYPPTTRNVLSVFGGRDLFADLDVENGFIIEDDRVFYSSRFPIVMNMSDDEIFASAVEHIEKGFEFMMVHFHSVDDVAHEYGPYSMRTMKQIEIVSGFVQGLRATWGKDMIVFSDHGLHSAGLRGRHGVNRIEDMVAVVWK